MVVPRSLDSIVSRAPMTLARSCMPTRPHPLPLTSGFSTLKPQPWSMTATCSHPPVSSSVTITCSEPEYLHALRMASWQMRYACVSSAWSKRSHDRLPSKTISEP